MTQQQKVQYPDKVKVAEQQPADQVSVQSVPQQEQTALQRVQPRYLDWPVSKPGPQSTPVPPGMKPISAIRREQVAEVGYNQETGEPGTQSPFRSQPDARITTSPSLDQAETAQEALHRRKHRIE